MACERPPRPLLQVWLRAIFLMSRPPLLSRRGFCPFRNGGATVSTLDDLFGAHKGMLWGLSYRLTGCAADADDVVQDAFVRAIHRTTPINDASWTPWLVRVTTNLAIDVLRRRRRQTYAGPWLPSPIETDRHPESPMLKTRDGPEARYQLIESISFAFLLALEALTPRQRAVLLLRDVFDYSAREVGVVLDVSEENVRIMLHRARRAMRDYDRTKRTATPAHRKQTQQLLTQFVRCLTEQDVAGLEALLADSVRTITDGGGEFTALHQPMVGREEVMHLHLRVAKRRAAGARIELRQINGEPAVLIEYASAEAKQAPRILMRCELDPRGLIMELHTILATRKLTDIHFARNDSSA
jgi:RNA polymerase sigma-70 factor, ECF subfamily